MQGRFSVCLSFALMMTAAATSADGAGVKSLSSSNGEAGSFDMTGTSVQQPANPAPGGVPPQNEAPSALLNGAWRVTQSGSMSCNSVGTISFVPSNGSEFNGLSNFHGFIGNVDGTISGDHVRFVINWTDALGGKDIDKWAGQLSADGSSITGEVQGAWTGRCTFVASRG